MSKDRCDFCLKSFEKHPGGFLDRREIDLGKPGKAVKYACNDCIKDLQVAVFNDDETKRETERMILLMGVISKQLPERLLGDRYETFVADNSFSIEDELAEAKRRADEAEAAVEKEAKKQGKGKGKGKKKGDDDGDDG